jgi:cysteinyl-tRNA synthetase
LDQAKGALTTLYTALRGLDMPPAMEATSDYAQRFFAAMDDDFSTPEAMAIFFELAREINRLRGTDEDEAARLGSQLRYLGSIIGLLQRDAEAFLRSGPAAGGLSDDEIESAIAARLAARKSKNWAEADRIRDELKSQGIVLEDGPSGTTWRRE